MLSSKWLFNIASISLCLTASLQAEEKKQDPLCGVETRKWCAARVRQAAHHARCSCGQIKGLVPRTKMLRKIKAIEKRGLERCKKEANCNCLSSVYKEFNEIIHACSVN